MMTSRLSTKSCLRMCRRCEVCRRANHNAGPLVSCVHASRACHLSHGSTSIRIGYTAYTLLHTRHIQALPTHGNGSSTSAPGYWRFDTRWRNTGRIDPGSSSCPPSSRHDTAVKELLDRIDWTGLHVCLLPRHCLRLLPVDAEAPPAKPANHLRLTTREDSSARERIGHILSANTDCCNATGDTLEGRNGGRGQPKPAAAASKQQRAKLTRGL